MIYMNVMYDKSEKVCEIIKAVLSTDCAPGVSLVLAATWRARHAMAGMLKLVDSKTFPAGLRVLVVDDDLLCLKVVEKMLKTCKYKGEGHREPRF